MPRKTKAELVDSVNKLTAELNELKRSLNQFLEDARPHYPQLCKNLDDAIDGQHYWIDEPLTGVVEAVIPQGASHVRWVFVDGCLEFQHNELGVRYWAAPLTGNYSEIS